MNLMHPIDINRIIGDNQRMQNQIRVNQDRYHKMLQQTEQLFKQNQSLRNQLDNSKQTHLDQIQKALSDNKSIYEKQLNSLRLQNHKLISQIQGLGDQQEVNNSLQSTVEQLKLQIQKQQYEAQIIRQECEQLRKLAESTEKQEKLEQIQIQFRRTKDLYNQQGLKLIQVELENKRLNKNEENSKKKINEFKAIVDSLEMALKQQRQRYAQLKKKHQDISERSPEGLINQLNQLRLENAALKNTKEQAVLATCDKDDDIFNLLQQFHQELNLLRLELNTVKTKRQQTSVQLYNERAKSHLQSVKFQKELQFIKNQNVLVKDKLKQSEKALALKKKEQNVNAKFIEEISTLKIKIFVLQSMKISERYRKIQTRPWGILEDKTNNIYAAINLNHNNSEILQSFVELNMIIKQLKQRLVEEETNKNAALKKYRNYKEKYLSLHKNIKQRDDSNQVLMQNYKLKINDYNKLIERLQLELQKSFQLNSENNQRNHNNLVASSYQSKIKTLQTQIIVLQNQIKHFQHSLSQQQQKYQKDIDQLNKDNSRLKQQNVQLSAKLRNAESQILQQSLAVNANRNADIKSYQAQIASKTTTIINLHKQLQNARRQFQTDLQAALKSQQQAKLKLQRDLARSRSQAANALFKSNIISQHVNNSQLTQVKEKLEYLEKRIGDQSNEGKNSYIIKLNNQLHSVREELQREKYNSNEKTNQLNLNEQNLESYKIRVMELEDTLKVISQQNDEKTEQINTMNAQYLAMSEHIDKLEEQITILRGQGSSLKQIQYIDINNQLNQSQEKLKIEIISMREDKQRLERENQKLRLQCETFQQENFRLLTLAKENNFHSNENKLMTEKYEKEREYKVNQLQNKLNNLTSENTILKDLIEELRGKLLEKQQSRFSESSSHNELQQLRNQLMKYQKDASYYKQEYQRIVDNKHRQKEIFQIQWNKLVAQLKTLRQQLQTQQKQQRVPSDLPKQVKKVRFTLPQIRAQRESQSQQSRIFTLQTQYQKRIYQLNSTIDQKNSQISRLQNEIDNLKYQATPKDTVSQEQLKYLRAQNQKMLSNKYSDEAKIRMLEQQITSLRIKKITDDVQTPDLRISPNALSSSQEAFASNRNSLIHQLGFEEGQDLRRELVQSQNYIQLINSKFAQNSTIQKRYEECLIMLVISWAQIESLRQRVIHAEKQADHQFNKYAESLNAFQGRDSDTFQSKKPNIALIKQIQCGHKHLMELSQGIQNKKGAQVVVRSGLSQYDNGRYNYGGLDELVKTSPNRHNLLQSFSSPGDNIYSQFTR